MARKIAIVGAGQAGLQLGFALLKEGYSVTLVTDKTGDEIAASQITATPALYWRGQQFEHDLGIDYWDDEVFSNKEVQLGIRNEHGELQLRVAGQFINGTAQMIDLRLKYPRWIEEFSRRGGELINGRPDVAALDTLAAAHDLLFIATGRANTSLFERNAERSIWPGPLRRVRAIFLDAPDLDRWNNTFVPGIGELAASPALGLGNRPGQALLVWGNLGGPLDFADGLNGAEVTEGIKAAFQRYNPDYYDEIADKNLLDDKAWVTGAVTPIVRNPTARLPSGRLAVALGDAAITVDPLTGQGLNNASYSADVFARSILAQGDEPLDAAWAESTAEDAWDFIRHSYLLNRVLLDPPSHQDPVFPAASRNPRLADELISGFPDPETTAWLHDPAKVNAKLLAHPPVADIAAE